MTEVETSREIYDFRCGRCGHAWERLYEVRRWQDQSGDEFSWYRVDGVQAVAPGNSVCPSCGGYRVRLLPLHTASDVRNFVDSADIDSADTDSADEDDVARHGWYGWAVLSEVCHARGIKHL